jgi:hypothetical protein
MNSAGIQILTDTFDPISLDDMDRVGFMNRIDTKYVFSATRIPDLLASLSRFYKVLEINNMRSLSYTTTYLDTSDYLFFRQHVIGKLERNKVRFRTYESTGTTFLEVKRRTNKNRTVKWRIENSLVDKEFCDDSAGKFLSKHIAVSSSSLKPVIINRFSRITLVAADMKERVTIDFDLSFTGNTGKMIKIPSLAIAELKRESGPNQSIISRVLKNQSIRPTGFSKYCIGASMLYDLPRKNILKSKQLLLNKIENEFTEYARA